jgi:hypothetical protein
MAAWCKWRPRNVLCTIRISYSELPSPLRLIHRAGVHLSLVLVLGIPAIMVFCIGAPLMFAWFLVTHRHLHDNKAFNNKFGFLYRVRSRTVAAVLQNSLGHGDMVQGVGVLCELVPIWWRFQWRCTTV